MSKMRPNNLRAMGPYGTFDIETTPEPADPPYQPPPGTRIYDRKGVEYLVPADGVMAGINRQYGMGAFAVINLTSGASRSSASWRASGLQERNPVGGTFVGSVEIAPPSPPPLVPFTGGTRVVARGVSFGEPSRGIIASSALADIVNQKYDMGTHVVITSGGGTSSYPTEEMLQTYWERDVLATPSITK